MRDRVQLNAGANMPTAIAAADIIGMKAAANQIVRPVL